MEFIRKNYQYGLCFLFVFLVLIFLGYPSMDTIWNYGCSVAITRGEIPYVDFSLLVPPLYSYFMSIFLLFSKDYTFYLIGQAILVTICYFLFLDWDTFLSFFQRIIFQHFSFLFSFFIWKKIKKAIFLLVQYQDFSFYRNIRLLFLSFLPPFCLLIP